MKKSKLIIKVLSVFLTLLLVVSALPLGGLTAFAKGNNTVDTETKQIIEANASNTFGGIIASAVDTTTEQREQNGGYGIFDAHLSGLSAIVHFSAPDDTTLIVAVYEENSLKMISSGRMIVNSAMEEAVVEMSACETPEYYVIKAFLVDKNNAPVCVNYENRDHTQVMQDFYEKSTEDFDAEKVINFDYSEEDNFAVISNDAVTVEQSQNTNILTTNDYENGIYVFKNADHTITSLKPGDILYFTYGSGSDEYILTKVGTIKNDKGTVTVTAADEYAISDFFSYIDLDTARVVDSPVATASFDDDRGNENQDKTASVSVKKVFEGTQYKISFSGAMDLTTHLKFEYDFKLFGEDYYVFEYWNEVQFKAETSIALLARVPLDPLTLVEASIPIFPGLDISVSLGIEFDFSAQLSVTGSLSISMKSGVKKVAGFAKQSLDNEPKVELKIEAEGKIKIEMKPVFKAGFKILKVFNVNLGFETGFPIEVTFFKPSVSSADNFTQDSIHTCLMCANGNIKWRMKIFLEVTFGISEKKQHPIVEVDFLSFEKELCDFYISIGASGPVFGVGECPNHMYRVIYNVRDASGAPLPGVQFGDKVTDANGQIKMYLPKGSHSFDLHSDTYQIKEPFVSTFYVESAQEIDITLVPIGENGNTGGSGGTENTSGTCGANGDNLTWTLHNDGELVIAGNGAMKDYTNTSLVVGDIPPWAVLPVRTVTIRQGVTSIGDRVFRGCSLTQVTIPNSVTSIGGYAFAYCGSLMQVTIPDSVTSIGYAAFRDCDSLTQVTIPNSVTSIEHTAFYGCDSLTQVTIPNSVTSIGGYAFAYCGSLMQVTIPNSVTIIGDDAFYGCDSLTQVTIPNSVTSIGDAAFAYCDSLTQVTIPNSVTSIGYDAFYSCNNLTTVYYGGTKQEWNAISIDSGNDLLTKAALVCEATEPQSVALSSWEAWPVTIAVAEPEETLQDAVVGNSYIMLVVKDANAEDLFAPENLLYIDQKTAESETLTFTFALKEAVSNYKVIFNGVKLPSYDSVPKVTLGDINGDGEVDPIDARWVLQASTNSRELTAEQQVAADVNTDSVIDAIDARWILQASTGSRTI